MSNLNIEREAYREFKKELERKALNGIHVTCPKCLKVVKTRSRSRGSTTPSTAGKTVR